MASIPNQAELQRQAGQHLLGPLEDAISLAATATSTPSTITSVTAPAW